MKLEEFSELRLPELERVQAVIEEIKNSGVFLDPFNIAKHNRIEYALVPITEPFALSIPNKLGKYTMYISSLVDRYSQKILCYHELGHVLCENIPNVYLFDHTIDHESEFLANYFAANFLPILSRMNIDPETSIEDVNDYITSLIIPSAHNLIYEVKDTKALLK